MCYCRFPIADCPICFSLSLSLKEVSLAHYDKTVSISDIDNRQCSSSLFRRSLEQPRCARTFQSYASLPRRPSCLRRWRRPLCLFGVTQLRAPFGRLRQLFLQPANRVQKRGREWLHNTRLLVLGPADNTHQPDRQVVVPLHVIYQFLYV